MQVFMKNSFDAYERLEEVSFVGNLDRVNTDIFTLKLNGVSNGKLKQIQVNISRKDITEIENLKIFAENVIKSMGEAGF